MRPTKVTVGKLAAVERQLDTAIWIWFNEGDIVSVVTLTGAALGILDGLFQDKKKGRPIPFTKEMVPEGMTATETMNLIKADENFAKHARHDPEEMRHYYYHRAAAYLFCAIASYYNFTGNHGEVGTLRGLFCLRYGSMCEDLYNPPRSTLQTPEQRAEVERLVGLSRSEFFHECGGDFVGNPPRPDWLIHGPGPKGHL